MRALVFIVLIGAVLILLGWVTVRFSGNNSASVILEKEKIQHDTERVLKEGSEVLDAAGDKVHEQHEDDQSHTAAPTPEPARN